MAHYMSWDRTIADNPKGLTVPSLAYNYLTFFLLTVAIISEIQKFEMFIDICNQRVMVQRERLSGSEGAVAAGRGLP